MKSNFQAKTKHWVNFRRFSESPPPCFGKICSNFFVSVIFVHPIKTTNLCGHCGLVTLSLFYIAILDKGTTFHSTFLWKLSWSELFWVENYPRRKTDVADYFAWKTHKSLAENAQKVNRLPFLKCRMPDFILWHPNSFHNYHNGIGEQKEKFLRILAHFVVG